MTEPIRLGTRSSILARTQTATVGDALARLSGRRWVEVLVRTAGDDTSRSLHQPGQPGLFVSALREALVRGEVDVIVHSFKDLPSAPTRGVHLAAIPSREDPRDALVSRDGFQLSELPGGAIVGTSSPRRSAAVLAIRPDLVITPIRGNVDSRIARVRSGQFDAVILAVAGIKRLGREADVTEILDWSVCLPAPAQGALAVECRADDDALISLVKGVDDPAARLTTSAEREVLVGIDASCTTAIAASADYSGGVLTLRAELFNEHGVAHAVAQRSAGIGVHDTDAARALGLLVAGGLMGGDQRPLVLLAGLGGNGRDIDSLQALGLPAICDPYLQTSPVAPPGLLDALAPADGTWLVVSSPMTIPACIATVGEEALRASLRSLRVAATGKRTADTLRALGCDDLLVPEDQSAAGLVEALAAYPPGRAVFPCGNLALRTIPDGLRALGWTVVEEVVYETETAGRRPASADLVRQGKVAAIVLRSPSAVRALTSFIMPDASVPVICGGRTTAAAARSAGLVVAATAAAPDPRIVAITVADALGHPLP